MKLRLVKTEGGSYLIQKEREQWSKLKGFTHKWVSVARYSTEEKAVNYFNKYLDVVKNSEAHNTVDRVLIEEEV